jgi:hypothetical protein
MAIFYQNNVGVKISTDGTTYVDLTDHVEAVTITSNYDQLDVSAMGTTGHQLIGGLQANTVAIDFLNDTATSSVLQTLNSIVGTNAKFKIFQTVSAIGAGTSTGTPSATNPLYSGLLFINKLTPIAGQIGTVAVQSLSFDVSGSLTVASSGTW